MGDRFKKKGRSKSEGESPFQGQHLKKYGLSSQRKQTSEDSEIKAAIAPGIHLYPFRTEKLSPVTPMVLRKWESR